MVERGCRVQGGQPKQAVGEDLMDRLRGMKDARICGDAKVQFGQPVVKGASVPHKGDKPENRDDDHQSIQETVRRKRKSTIELADVGRQIGRLVRRPPPKSGDDQGEIDKPDAAMDVDPERARLLRDVVEQETQRSEKHD